MDTQTFWTTVGLIATAVIAIVPLAHRALDANPAQRTALHLTGAVAMFSFTLEAGVVAAAMTAPWLALGLTLTLEELRAIGWRTLVDRPTTAVVGSLATWAWMAAGGGWLTAHRLGIEPLGFDRPITLLTVAHFHVAGLGLTALMAATYQRRPSRPLLGAAVLHQAGMLTVAAGLTFNDHMEVAGAAMITVALAVWAAAAARWLRAGMQGRARILLAVAAISWVLPMALAVAWALGPFLPEPLVTTFLTMLRYHAALQTFGLVLCGLGGVLATERTVAIPTVDIPNTQEAHHVVARQTNA